jgi:hypothetical protein
MIELIGKLQASGAVSAEDVLALRRAVWGDGRISPAEAEALVDLDEAAHTRAPEWRDFFVEALTHAVVGQQPPAGHVSERHAEWLIGLLARDGRGRTDGQLELLVRVLETAERAPASLVAFTLTRIRDAVLDGDGPLFRAVADVPPRVTAGEAALLRRLLYAASGDGNLAITRAEAELLFDINDLCRGGDNDPDWTDLFSKAIAASVMTVSGYAPLSAEEALRREAWLEPSRNGVAGFLKRMFDFKAAAGPWRAEADEAARQAAKAATARAAEAVSADEASWLVSRIGRDGEFDAAERSVIDFLRRESPDIDPALRPLLGS